MPKTALKAVSLFTKKGINHQVRLSNWAQSVDIEMATVLQEGATVLFPFKLLNSYFEILLNPEKGAVNREAARLLHYPVERGAWDCPEPFSVHPPNAAANSPGTHPVPHLKTAAGCPGEYSVSV